MSRTVTVNDLLALLPEPSVAVQLTVVVPTGNVLPDAGTQDGVRVPLTVSVAETPEYVTAAPPGPVASSVIGPGTVSTGGVVSCTVTLNELLPVFPAPSVAVHLTAVVPTGNVPPEPGRQVGVRLPLTASVADAPG